jgi:hypothetical protein
MIHQPQNNGKDSQTTNGFYEQLVATLPLQGISVSTISTDDLQKALHYLPEDIKNIVWTSDKESAPKINQFLQEQNLSGKNLYFIEKKRIINNPGKEAEIIRALIENQSTPKERK